MASIQINEMKYMTWKEYEARPDAAIALCVGSVEQHGPHLPMSCDALIAYRFACALAETMDLIVAPELFFGYRSQPASGGGLHFPGTTSLSGETLIHLLDDILEDFYRQGRKRFVIVDGHYENQSFAAEAAYLFTARHPDAKVVFMDWWRFISRETLNVLFHNAFPGWECEHASVTETSLVMHFAPELVHADRIPHQVGKQPEDLPLIYPEPKGAVPESGILYTAEGASAEIGKVLAQEAVEKGSAFIKEALGMA